MSDDSSVKEKPVSKGWGIPGSVFLGAAMFIFPALVAVTLGPTIAALNLSLNAANFLMELLFSLILIGVVVAVVRAYGLRLADIGVGRFKLYHIGVAVLGVVAYLLLSTMISNLVGHVLPYDQNEAQQIGYSDPSQIEMLLVFVALVILAPLGEELLFRGFMFRGLRKRLPFWLTAVIVSALFGLAHGQINVGLDVFALSLVLCYLREKTDSLWPCILLHSTKNLIAFLLLFVFKVNLG